jgi:hypothetical protein
LRAQVRTPYLQKGLEMKQSQLNRAVALATGEAVSTIRRMGFSIVDPTTADNDSDELPRPRTVNWDRVDANRPGYLPQRARLHRKFA